MTNQATLTKAIQKAIDGGWTETIDSDDLRQNYKMLIFNHGFAKALWGEREHDADMALDSYGSSDCRECGGSSYVPDYCWEYHLQQMVIADDPIRYLGENI